MQKPGQIYHILEKLLSLFQLYKELSHQKKYKLLEIRVAKDSEKPEEMME